MVDLYVVLGGGVIGLTTALELSSRYPHAQIIILAKHLPGDSSINYTSPWAGANWLSTATDNGRQEGWDAVTYRRFTQLADNPIITGIQKMSIRASYDSPVEEAGVLSQETGRIWYEELVGGLRWLGEGEKAEGSVFGYECDSFVINVQVYLPWLQVECLNRKIEIRRAEIFDISEVFQRYPNAKAVFNCTGLGSFFLKGVEDKTLYPTRGQVMLIETPNTPLTRMYFRSPQRVNKDTTYVFPRNPGGGVILGGCRFNNEWGGEIDLSFAEDIKRRCCALAPELGRPEDLKVIQHMVGLRPSRIGGARIEKQMYGKFKVIHNYGASGTGYQASWGMAKEAVDLLQRESKM